MNPESMPLPGNNRKIETSPLAESVRLPEKAPDTNREPMTFEASPTLKSPGWEPAGNEPEKEVTIIQSPMASTLKQVPDTFKVPESTEGGTLKSPESK